MKASSVFLGSCYSKVRSAPARGKGRRSFPKNCHSFEQQRSLFFSQKEDFLHKKKTKLSTPNLTYSRGITRSRGVQGVPRWTQTVFITPPTLGSEEGQTEDSCQGVGGTSDSSRWQLGRGTAWQLQDTTVTQAIPGNTSYSRPRSGY